MILPIKQRGLPYSANTLLYQKQKSCGRECYRLSRYGEGLP